MRILVTGGAGYIGSHCVTELLNSGQQVSIVDNLSTGFESSLAKSILRGAKFYNADVRSLKQMKQILQQDQIEAILHFAAKLIVPESVEHPLEYFDNNVGGSISLLQACKDSNVRFFVFSSTAAVYGFNTNGICQETDATLPINPYGSSKLMVEKILMDHAATKPNFKCTILRYFNVAGASLDGENGQRTKKATHLVKVASEVAAGKRNVIEIFGADWSTADGTCIRDYIHIEDLVGAHISALKKMASGHPGGIFNCGYGRGYSVKEVIDMVAKVSQKIINTKIGPRRPGDPESITANPMKIKKELEWQPRFDSLEIICKTAFEWENRDSKRGHEV